MPRRVSFAEIMGLKPREPEEPGAKKSIHIDPSDMSLHVSGYTPSEVSDMLAVYRAHQDEMIGVMARMAESNARVQSSADAVRYTPAPTFGPEDIMGEEDPGT